MNFDINKIPHINEIANNGSFNGARSKNTETFQQRCRDCNKIVPSLEEAIKKSGLRDGMTISFHHHFRNGDHIINNVLDKLAEMGFKNLTLENAVDPPHRNECDYLSGMAVLEIMVS